MMQFSQLFNFVDGKLTLVRNESAQDPFIPFQDERDDMGRLKSHQVRSRQFKSKKVDLHQERQILSEKRKRYDLQSDDHNPISKKQHKNTLFLRDIYSSPDHRNPKKRNSLINLKDHMALDIAPEVQSVLHNHLDQQIQNHTASSHFKFEKKQQFNELYRDQLTSRVSPLRNNTRTQGRLGKFASMQHIPPPIGYYDYQSHKSKTPMFVQMDHALKTDRIPLKVHNPVIPHVQRVKVSHSQQKSTVIMSIGKECFRKALELEKQLMKDKMQYLPKPLEFNTISFDQFNINLDNMKKKVRFMRNELNSWADKQGQVLKQSQNKKL